MWSTILLNLRWGRERRNSEARDNSDIALASRDWRIPTEKESLKAPEASKSASIKGLKHSRLINCNHMAILSLGSFVSGSWRAAASIWNFFCAFKIPGIP